MPHEQNFEFKMSHHHCESCDLLFVVCIMPDTKHKDRKFFYCPGCRAFGEHTRPVPAEVCPKCDGSGVHSVGGFALGDCEMCGATGAVSFEDDIPDGYVEAPNPALVIDCPHCRNTGIEHESGFAMGACMYCQGIGKIQKPMPPLHLNTAEMPCEPGTEPGPVYQKDCTHCAATGTVFSFCGGSEYEQDECDKCNGTGKVVSNGKDNH